MEEIRSRQGKKPGALMRYLIPAVFLLILINAVTVKFYPTRQPRRIEIQTLKDLAELATIEYDVKKIIKAKDVRWYGDRKILIETAAVLKAGIDLGELSKQDILINGDAITINLPQPRLLQLDMKPRDMREIFNDSGTLRQDFSNEEKDQLLIQGQEDIKNRIAEMGILKRAAQNTKLLLESWIKQTGFREVNIVFKITQPAGDRDQPAGDRSQPAGVRGSQDAQRR